MAKPNFEQAKKARRALIKQLNKINSYDELNEFLEEQADEISDLQINPFQGNNGKEIKELINEIRELIREKKESYPKPVQQKPLSPIQDDEYPDEEEEYQSGDEVDNPPVEEQQLQNPGLIYSVQPPQPIIQVQASDNLILKYQSDLDENFSFDEKRFAFYQQNQLNGKEQTQRANKIRVVMDNLMQLENKIKEFSKRADADNEYASASSAALTIYQGLAGLIDNYLNEKIELSEFKSQSEQFIKEKCQDELEVLNSPRGWKAKTIVTNILFALGTLFVGYGIGVMVTGRFSVFQPQTEAAKRMDDLTQSINALTIN